ncbi:hypothetical protein AKJ61_04710 [candidate division MSBL1 archaeon SCGC-AAA259B11]|uniref:DUF4242 domain-containing protein n=1 Tax=candidate division MSBL1 archaeon SCGC-AAA259B11 TaxID=1698260 RepID=A0A133U2W6_9EURY|nr:hypothetical protein AKJ61_04710 [candidate division MSBL1 archaeon SCGC-AAA259B11]
MSKFLAVHPMPEPMTVEDATPVGEKTKSLSNADAYWVSSWAQLDDEGKIVKLFCEWNAKSLEDVEDLIEKTEVPTEGVYPMMKVDSEDFR